MITYESSVSIERAPAVVFPYIVEPAKQAKWSDVEMRLLTPGSSYGRGSKFEVVFGMGPIKARLGLEITELEQDRLMAWKTLYGPIRWEGAYRLEPAGAGTTLSQHGTLVFMGLWRLLEPIAGAEIRTAEEKELVRLKALVEGA